MDEGDCGLLLPPDQSKPKDSMFSLTQVWTRILALVSGLLFLFAFACVVYFITIEVIHSRTELPDSSNKTSLEWHLSDLFPGPCLTFRSEECDGDCRKGETAVCGQCYNFACWCAWHPADANRTADPIPT